MVTLLLATPEPVQCLFSVLYIGIIMRVVAIKNLKGSCRVICQLSQYQNKVRTEQQHL